MSSLLDSICEGMMFSGWPSAAFFRSPWYEQVTPMLRDLQCLRSPPPIDFKLAVHIYRCLHGTFPTTFSSSWLISTAAPSDVIIFAACEPTYTAIYCRRSCIAVGWKPPLEQFSTRRHISSNADCFFGTALKLIFLLDNFFHNC